MTTLLDVEDVQMFLDDELVYLPNGQQGWHFTIDTGEDGDYDILPDYWMLVLVNNFARHSREHDFNSETDDWTMLDGKTQRFAMQFLATELKDPERLRYCVAKLVAYAGAHEALEWLRQWVGVEAVMVHDPHEDGDVVVHL